MNSTSNPSYDELIQQAEAHLNAYEHDKVIKCATQAIKLDKNRPDAYYLRGRATALKLKNARKDADALLACRPITPRHFAYRGWAYYCKGESLQAITECTEALRQDASVKEAYLFRGCVYSVLKNFNLAKKDYDEFIKIAPQYAEAYCRVGFAHDHPDNPERDLKRAANAYKTAIRHNAKHFVAICSLGNIYYNKKTKEGNKKAIEFYNQAIDICPDYAWAHHLCGKAHYNNKNNEQAIQKFKDSININKKNAFAYFNLANIYCEQEKYDFAVENYSKAVECELPNLGRVEHNFLCSVAKASRSLQKADIVKQLKGVPNFWISLVHDMMLNVKDEDCYTNCVKLAYAVYNYLTETQRTERNTASFRYLYQYAECSVADKISKSCALWLKPACYQNDPGEGKYIFDYLESHTKINNSLKTLMRESKAKNEFDQKTVAFIRSFSECKDGLQMWNSSYARNGAGIALGIQFGKFSKATDTSASVAVIYEGEKSSVSKFSNETKASGYVPMEKIYFAQVRYLSMDNKTTKSDTAAFDKNIITVLKKFTDNMLKEPKNREAVKKFLPLIFMPISHLVKSSDYEHEKEWRLLYFTTIKDGKDSERIIWEPVLHVKTEPFLFKDKKTKEQFWLGPAISELERLKLGHQLEHELGDYVDIHMSKVHFRDPDAGKSSEK